MRIGHREISSDFPPYIVAEISCNHMGRLDYALRLIKEAKDAGADAVKFQCYTAEELTLDCDKPDFIIKDGPWKGRKLYELYEKAHTPRNWFGDLFAYARGLRIEMFCSVFSPAGVDFLEQFNPVAYKIASMEITDIPLIEYAAQTRKALIISTGMASNNEIDEAFNAFQVDVDVALLHCVSGYPTPIEEADLHRLFELIVDSSISLPVGISDHTVGWEVPVAATALDARIIEKHLMLDLPVEEYMPEDFNFSMRPEEFAAMARKARAVWQAMRPSNRKSEESSRQLRRSLYVVRDMKVGDRFTTENVRSIRPAYGMAPKDLPYVLSSIARRDIEAGTALKEEYLIGP